jgi:uncharacterized protein
VRIEELRFTSPRRWGASARSTLAGTLYLPSAADSEEPPGPARLPPGLVVAHGAGSNRDRHDAFCREACSGGFVVLALDLRGHGASGGIADGPLELDVLAAADVLRQHEGVDSEAICFRGSSMGGFYGLKSAPAARFAAIALLCPASEQVMLDAIQKAREEASEDASGSHRQEPEVRGRASLDPADIAPARWDLAAMTRYFEEQDSVALARAVTCPALLVHARGDEVVPVDHSLTLARRLGGDTALMISRGGSHTSAQHDPQTHFRTTRWLRERAAPLEQHHQR